MLRAYFSSTFDQFRDSEPDSILGRLASSSEFDVTQTQRDAWKSEIELLKEQLPSNIGRVFLEFSIPRMGRRVDALILVGSLIVILEFKVGEREATAAARDQVWDYALDLKNFHETSHAKTIVPVVVATDMPVVSYEFRTTAHGDNVLVPVQIGSKQIGPLLRDAIGRYQASGDDQSWESGGYRPTPTIIEAALALYGHHKVVEIARTGADAPNLQLTTAAVEDVIQQARQHGKKILCFVTGVPGAGKTLVGLDIANRHMDPKSENYSVYLSGNGPLVAILQEALARDAVARDKRNGRRTTKVTARSQVKAFIQNVHHFRDECLRDEGRAPVEHIAIFDEAQRAWNREMTSDFMQRKKHHPGFDQSESEFLISCLNRHADWAVIICLVGGGQEINRGEAGIGEWIASLKRSFPDWDVHYSPQLAGRDYLPQEELQALAKEVRFRADPRLHLKTSMRSFRASSLSGMVNALLDLDTKTTSELLRTLDGRYPLALTRDVQRARSWLRAMARGNERYGIVVSSGAERLKPHAIDVRSRVDPVQWFLGERTDTRSSFYLEDVATEFQVQGLELDWACLTWDADLRKKGDAWDHWRFQGSRWNRVHVPARKRYLENAYRVLLTRARQGMIIVVPEGNPDDPTRNPAFYDPTFQYLRDLGIQLV